MLTLALSVACAAGAFALPVQAEDPALRAEITESFAQIDLGTPMWISFRVLDAKGPVDSWSVDWGDGTPATQGNGESLGYASHTYQRAGSFTITLSASAAGESAQDSRPILVNRTPVFLFADTIVSTSRAAQIGGQIRRPGGPATPSGDDFGVPLPGKSLVFVVGSERVCEGVSDADGRVTCPETAAWAKALAARSYEVRFAGDATYAPGQRWANLLP